MNQFPEVPKDALVIEYSRNGKDYLSGGILERNTYLGIDTVIE